MLPSGDTFWRYVLPNWPFPNTDDIGRGLKFVVLLKLHGNVHIKSNLLASFLLTSSFHTFSLLLFQPFPFLNEPWDYLTPTAVRNTFAILYWRPSQHPFPGTAWIRGAQLTSRSVRLCGRLAWFKCSCQWYDTQIAQVSTISFYNHFLRPATVAGSLGCISFARFPLPEAGPYFICMPVFGGVRIPIRFSMTDTLMLAFWSAAGFFVFIFYLALLFIQR